MKKVVFLGAKEIGYQCLKVLFEQGLKLDYQIVGVVTNLRGQKVVAFCKENHIAVLSDLNEYVKVKEVDIAISVQYHEILRKIHIAKAKEITVNLHMAPLPEYRGCNQFSFAIIDGAKEFGTTIHRLEEGIDSGPIVFETRFPIPSECWVDELYDLTFKESLKLFKEKLEELMKGQYHFTAQDDLLSERKTSIHYRKEAEEIKQIDLSWSREKIQRHVRATCMPGFEPPYTVIAGKKVHFKSLSEFSQG